MRFSPATVYSTGHGVNETISDALQDGFKADRVPASNINDLKPGLALCYGILRGTGDILKECEKKGIDYLYCDHSFFDGSRVSVKNPATKDSGYFRLIPNDRYFGATKDCPSDRWEKLGIELKDWQTGGEHVVIIPPTAYVGAFYSFDDQEWLDETIAILKEHTDRRLLVKYKNSPETLEDVLTKAWAVVTYTSMAAVEALIQGIPAFCSESAAAAPMADLDLTQIENPARSPRRYRHLCNMAYQQFMFREIKDGTAKSILMSQFAEAA